MNISVKEYDNIPLKPAQRLSRLSTLTDVAKTVRESRQDRPQVLYYQADRPRTLSTPAVDTWNDPVSLSYVTRSVRRTFSSSDYPEAKRTRLAEEPELRDLNPTPSPLLDQSPIAGSQNSGYSPPPTPSTQADNLLEEEEEVWIAPHLRGSPTRDDNQPDNSPPTTPQAGLATGLAQGLGARQTEGPNQQVNQQTFTLPAEFEDLFRPLPGPEGFVRRRFSFSDYPTLAKSLAQSTQRAQSRLDYLDLGPAPSPLPDHASPESLSSAPSDQDLLPHEQADQDSVSHPSPVTTPAPSPTPSPPQSPLRDQGLLRQPTNLIFGRAPLLAPPPVPAPSLPQSSLPQAPNLVSVHQSPLRDQGPLPRPSNLIFQRAPLHIDDPDTEMDDKFMPGPFHGRSEENGEEWLRHFEKYCTYKSYTGDKQLALIKVLMKGHAADWMETLPPGTTAIPETIGSFKAAFQERYKPPATMKFKSAKELYSRRQRDDESADDFIESMRKLSREVAEGQEADNMARYAILSGLKPNLATFVTQKEPTTLEDVVKAARLAELTCQDPIEQVRDEIKRLTERWDKLTVSSIMPSSEGNRPLHNRSPSPISGQKHVSFKDTQSGPYCGNFTASQPQGFSAPQPHQQWYSSEGFIAPQPAQFPPQFPPVNYMQQASVMQPLQPAMQQAAYTPYGQVPYGGQAPMYATGAYMQNYPNGGGSGGRPFMAGQYRGGRRFNGRPGMRGSGRGRGYFGPQTTPAGGQGADGYQQPQAASTGEQCSNCGRPQHTNALECTATLRTCNACGKRGHYALMCRSAARGNRFGSGFSQRRQNFY